MTRFHITFPNGESLNVQLTRNLQKGVSLLNTVFDHLNLPADTTKYFGLSYSDKHDGGKNWIQKDDNLTKIDAVKSANSIPAQLEIQILPRDPHGVFTTLGSLRLAREYLKNMLVRDSMRCETVQCAAILDALIVQSDLGNYDNVKNNYSKHMNALDVYLPTYVLRNDVLFTENDEYVKHVRRYHVMLKDVGTVQANVMFLSKAEDMPYYGYVFHTISDSIRKHYLLALSPYGIHFIYDTCLGVEIAREKQETFEWRQFIGCTQVNRRHFKIKLFVTESTTTVRKFKIKSPKDAVRFMWDLDKCKEVVGTGDEIVKGTGDEIVKPLLKSLKDEEIDIRIPKLIPMYGSCI